MKIIKVVCKFVLLSETAMAQPPACRSSVYFEALGNGLLYSVNYDRLPTKSIGGRIGASYFAPDQISMPTGDSCFGPA